MKVFSANAVLLILAGSLLVFFRLQNQSLFIALNSLLPVPSLWLVITTLGDGAVAGCLFYLLFRRKTELLAKGLIGGVLGLITSQGLKELLVISRPEHTIDIAGKFYLLTDSMTATNFSMPSGHTLTAFLLGTLLLHYVRLNVASQITLVVLMILIALSRIALGVHWPADVLVGAGLGMFIAIGCIRLPTEIKNTWGKVAVHVLYLPFAFALVYKYFA